MHATMWTEYLKNDTSHRKTIQSKGATRKATTLIPYNCWLKIVNPLKNKCSEKRFSLDDFQFQRLNKELINELSIDSTVRILEAIIRSLASFHSNNVKRIVLSAVKL